MVANFLAKWTRRSTARSELQAALGELEDVLASAPDAAVQGRWLREVLPDLAAAEPPPRLDMTAQRAIGLWSEQQFLLHDAKLDVGRSSVRRRWRRACASLAAAGHPQASELLAAGKMAPNELQILLNSVVQGRYGAAAAHTPAVALQPAVAVGSARVALFPLLRHLGARWTTPLESVVWHRGTCPLCNSWALLAEMRGLDQATYLRCGLCAAAWRVPRMWCAGCGTRDHRQLGFLQEVGQNQVHSAIVRAGQVAICNACGHYSKLLNTLDALPPLGLWLADLSSLHLDAAAAERGYRPLGG